MALALRAKFPDEYADSARDWVHYWVVMSKLQNSRRRWHAASSRFGLVKNSIKNFAAGYAKPVSPPVFLRQTLHMPSKFLF